MSFRDILTQELRRRKAVNHRYSLRAFARSLQMDPSTLSKILRGKRELSMSTAFRVANYLEFPGDLVTTFLQSVNQSARELRERRRLVTARVHCASDGN